MPMLYPRDYEAPSPATPAQVTQEELKAMVRAYVTEPRYYSEIEAKVKAGLAKDGKYVRNRDVRQAIAAVDREWHPPLEEPKQI